MGVTEIIQILSFVAATIAVGVTVKTYSRNKDIELQNHLFQLKMVAFSNIIAEFVKMASLLQNASTKLSKLIRINEIEERNARINKLADRIDFQIIEINKAIGKNSVYFSSKITTMLSSFIEKTLEDPEFNNYDDIQKAQEFLIMYIDKQVLLMEEIIEESREELGLEQLNEKLIKRVKKGFNLSKSLE